MTSMNKVFADLPVTVFEAMSQAARDNNAINLGQGFPDDPGPEDVRRKAAEAVINGWNQYPPMMGIPELRRAIAAHYRHWQGLDLDPDREVMVTSGATEALAAAILAVLSPGDEAIVFTPAYDAYAPLIRRAGATVREVSLRPPEWRIDREMLDAAIGPNTRAIIFNNPHNPTGRLYDLDELEVVAGIARGHDLVVISDEVWEHILLDDQSFTPLASLPGMAERTIKCGSAGKIFSLTGWKVGWLVASPELATLAARAHQFLTFATAPNLQAAVAFGLDEGDAWIAPMRARFARARDLMAEGLRGAGFAVLDSAATYFQCVDLQASGVALDDEAFARLAVEQAGVAVVPISAFAEQEPPRHLVRLCFAKQDETIERGVAALANARELAR